MRPEQGTERNRRDPDDEAIVVAELLWFVSGSLTQAANARCDTLTNLSMSRFSTAANCSTKRRSSVPSKRIR